MTALTVPAHRWDAANRIPAPEAVLLLHCSEGHDVSISHRNWHLLDQTRCDLCGCLADLIYARRHTPCRCEEAAPHPGDQRPQTPTPDNCHRLVSTVTEDDHLLAA